MFRTLVRPFALAAAGVALALTAGAQPASAASCAVSAVKIGDLAASACGGSFAGNDSGANSIATDLFEGGLFSEFGVTEAWELVGKSDDGDDGVTASGGGSGSWTIDFGGAVVDTFVISLKAGNAFSVFLFTDLDPAATAYTGTFDTLLAGLTGEGDLKSSEALSTAKAEREGAEKAKSKAEKSKVDATAKAKKAEEALAQAKAEKKKAEAAGDDKKAKQADAKVKDAEKKAKAAKQEEKKAAKELAAAEKKVKQKQSEEKAAKTSLEKELKKTKAAKKAEAETGKDLSHITVGTFSSASSLAVPVPAALPLLATGMAVFAGFGWRRRAARA